MRKLKRAAFTLWSKCNGSCGYCYNKDRKQKQLQLHDREKISVSEFEKILNQAVALGLEDIQISGGEPLLEPEEVIEMVKLSKDSGVHIGIFTNGSLLNQDIIERLYNIQLDWIRIGIGGYDFKTHSLERGGTPERFDNIVKAIKASINRGLKTRLFVPITKNTFPFIEKTCDFIAKEFHGLDHVVFDSYIPNGVPEKDRKFQMSPEEHYTAIGSLLKARRKHKIKIIPYYGCFEFLSSEWNGENVLKSPCGKERLAFLSNGDITPCLCTLDVLGNFREKDFNLKEIVDNLSYFAHYDYSSHAPCSDCSKYDLCRDAWCPSLTVNARGNYNRPPATCPAVREYEALLQDGISKKIAIRESLKHNLKGDQNEGLS